MEEAARELGIPAKTLRAVEWDRGDLLGGFGEVARIERRYADFLGLIVAPPAGEATVTPPPSPPPLSRARTAAPAAWLLPLGSLTLPLAIILVAIAGEARLKALMLGLTLLSALLLAGAVTPPGILARAHVPASSFARFRQPLVLSAIGILAPVALAAVLAALI